MFYSSRLCEVRAGGMNTMNTQDRIDRPSGGGVENLHAGERACRGLGAYPTTRLENVRAERHSALQLGAES